MIVGKRILVAIALETFTHHQVLSLSLPIPLPQNASVPMHPVCFFFRAAASSLRRFSKTRDNVSTQRCKRRRFVGC